MNAPCAETSPPQTPGQNCGAITLARTRVNLEPARMTLHTAFQLAGLAHLASLGAILVAPRTLHWETELAKLPRLLRQMCDAYHYYTAATIAACGLASLFLADELVQPNGLSRSLCGYIALFWAARLILQFTYDSRPHLKTASLRIAYHGLTVLFVAFIGFYGWATLRAG
jgi:hypothetical protein